MVYTLIRSNRKTLGISISREGEVIVRAPLRTPKAEIDRLLGEKRDWIERNLAKQAQRRANHPEPNQATLLRWQEQAMAYLPDRIAYYARLMGVEPAKIRLSTARSRFGSCNSKNQLMFSLYLMDYPQAAIDYVVVHELAHIRHKNHGKEFYTLITSVMPDYKEREKLLKQ